MKVPGGSRRRVLRLANRAARLTRKDGADLDHPTYYGSAALAPESADWPMVVTIHDMTPELFPELFPKGNPHVGKRQYVESADVVLCVSENTRKDLLNLYGPIRAPTLGAPGCRRAFQTPIGWPSHGA